MGIFHVPLPVGYFSAFSSCLDCCVWSGLSVLCWSVVPFYCGGFSQWVGLDDWLAKVSWLGKLVSVFWCMELDFFSLPSKTMGCFSGHLMSSASNQKLFRAVCSEFKCSCNEFVGEKVVSPSYSSTILAPPQVFVSSGLKVQKFKMFRLKCQNSPPWFLFSLDLRSYWIVGELGIPYYVTSLDHLL